MTSWSSLVSRLLDDSMYMPFQVNVLLHSIKCNSSMSHKIFLLMKVFQAHSINSEISFMIRCQIYYRKRHRIALVHSIQYNSSMPHNLFIDEAFSSTPNGFRNIIHEKMPNLFQEKIQNCLWNYPRWHAPKAHTVPTGGVTIPSFQTKRRAGQFQQGILEQRAVGLRSSYQLQLCLSWQESGCRTGSMAITVVS